MTGLPGPNSGIHPSTEAVDRFQPSSTTGMPNPALGPAHFSRDDIRPADTNFQAVASYRSYRLLNTDPNTGPAVSRYVGDYVKLVNPTLSIREFDESLPISVFEFLSAFKKMCDQQDIGEGLALLVLPHVLEGDARALVEENFELSGIGFGGYRSWPEAAQLLLMNYANDRNIKDATRAFDNCAMKDDENETNFGRRLQSYATLCGGVISPQKMVTRFCDGSLSYMQRMVLERGPNLPVFNRYQACVDKAAPIGATQRAVFSQASLRNRASRTERPRSTRVNQIEFTPLPPQQISDTSVPVLQFEMNEGYAAASLADSEPSYQTAAVMPSYLSRGSPQLEVSL